MKYISINTWNTLSKVSDEVDVIAEEDDLAFEIGGIAFLIQRKNNFNNVVCLRISKSDMTFLQVVKVFREVMLENEIRYIRVEGSNNRYRFLQKMLGKLWGTKVGILKDTDTVDRNVQYIKCY